VEGQLGLQLQQLGLGGCPRQAGGRGHQGVGVGDVVRWNVGGDILQAGGQAGQARLLWGGGRQQDHHASMVEFACLA
jgi:hypothetical protein